MLESMMLYFSKFSSLVLPIYQRKFRITPKKKKKNPLEFLLVHSNQQITLGETDILKIKSPQPGRRWAYHLFSLL